MIRTVLFTLILALGAVTVMLPAASAHAGNEKGFFGFFNRTKEDGSASGKPVHMQPGTSGAGKSSGIKPFSFGKNPAAQIARYEDSPVNEERARAAKTFESWNANELAKANASTEALMAQVKAQQQYNAQLARQQQAQRTAQANSPGGLAARNAAIQQALKGTPIAVGAAPPAPEVPKVTSEAPKTEKPKRERKSQTLFNRVTE